MVDHDDSLVDVSVEQKFIPWYGLQINETSFFRYSISLKIFHNVSRSTLLNAFSFFKKSSSSLFLKDNRLVGLHIKNITQEHDKYIHHRLTKDSILIIVCTYSFPIDIITKRTCIM